MPSPSPSRNGQKTEEERIFRLPLVKDPCCEAEGMKSCIPPWNGWETEEGLFFVIIHPVFRIWIISIGLEVITRQSQQGKSELLFPIPLCRSLACDCLRPFKEVSLWDRERSVWYCHDYDPFPFLHLLSPILHVAFFEDLKTGNHKQKADMSFNLSFV